MIKAKKRNKIVSSAVQSSRTAAETKSKSAPERGSASSQSRKAAPTDPADILKGFATSTSRVVKQAASILEEEIAAGILAAKQIEEQMINVQKVRTGKPDEVMQLFRRDLHEVVDIAVDVIHAATNTVLDLAQRAVNVQVRDTSGKEPRKSPGATPTITPAEALNPGELGELTMCVENDSDALTANFSFSSSDLVNAASGTRIPATAVRFTPASLTLNPHGGEDVKVTFRIPPKTVSGTYAGLIQSNKLSPQVRAVLSVQIR